MARLNRAGQIARELNVLCDELGRLNRTSIGEAQALLEAIFELHRLAIHRLAEAET
jgi:hypothetical protein